MTPPALVIAGACLAGLLASAAGVVPGTLGQVLGLSAWIAPGIVLLASPSDMRPWWPLSRNQWLFVLAAAVSPMVLVILGTAVACLMGRATWDPGGLGLQIWWGATLAGRTALEVSDLGTLALGQTGLVVGAPLYALPAGLGVAAWSLSVPERIRPVAVALLTAVLCGLGALPAGPPALPGLLVLAGAGFGGLAGSFGRSSPWATAVGIAALHGLPGLGPLLAFGSTAVVGFTGATVWGAAGVAAVFLGIGLERLRDTIEHIGASTNS